jgi:hypothetical protein
VACCRCRYFDRLWSEGFEGLLVAMGDAPRGLAAGFRRAAPANQGGAASEVGASLIGPFQPVLRRPSQSAGHLNVLSCWVRRFFKAGPLGAP